MIRLDNVSKVYKGQITAIRDATADIAKGEFVFLVGPSGSGKSTVLRLINKEEQPTAGEIWVAGKMTNDLSPWRGPYLLPHTGSGFQDFYLPTNKTGDGNV